MRRRLLDVLVDPRTGAPLRLIEDSGGGDPVIEGTLLAPSGARHPVIRGVPRFVAGESYSGSFGLQWNRFAEVQLDSFTGSAFSRRRFDTETGWTREDLEGRWVVDAGCGAGRFAEVAASYGAEVVAVDLSSAVDAAQSNLGRLPNVHVIQADIRQIPVASEAIDFLYCIGVLQHTPDPPATARALVEPLRPGARFAFTAYQRRGVTLLHSKYLVRRLTRRLDPNRLLRWIERAMPVLFPVTSVLFSIPILGRCFAFVIPVANYVDERRKLPREIRYKEAVLDTFDMLSPQHDSPLKREDVERILRPLCTELDITERPLILRGVRGERDGQG